MTLSRPVIVFAGAALVAAVAAFFIVSQSQTPARDDRIACDGTSVGLGAEAPWQYVALFSYDCAAAAPVADRDARVRLALDYGYPSLLVRDIGEAEICADRCCSDQRGGPWLFFGRSAHCGACCVLARGIAPARGGGIFGDLAGADHRHQRSVRRTHA